MQPVQVVDGWFSESQVMWPGQKLSLQVENVLFHEKSLLQDVLVFDSTSYGRVLVLDGVIQLTERDEFAYQEMIAHLPLFAHPNPQRVLIVGGGDGGVLREVVKHASVTTITMCEIDPLVVQVSRRFFATSMATAFDDPRLQLVHQDAALFLQNVREPYDVIIVDSSDPVGPAETLFQLPFYQSLQQALTPAGVVCTQGECLWLHLDLIADTLARFRSLFSHVQYGYTTVPTYPSGQIGFVLSSGRDGRGDAIDRLDRPTRTVPPDMSLRYYSSEMHAAAFVLPVFAQNKLKC